MLTSAFIMTFYRTFIRLIAFWEFIAYCYFHRFMYRPTSFIGWQDDVLAWQRVDYSHSLLDKINKRSSWILPVRMQLMIVHWVWYKP